MAHDPNVTPLARTHAEMRPGMHYAYAIVASCIAMTCLPCALVLSCAGIFFTPVSEFFGVPKAEFTLYFSILNLSMMLTLPLAGKLMGKVDLRAMLSACVVLCGAGCAAMGACRAMWQFYLCGAAMGVGLAPMLYLAVPTLIDAWFARRVGFFVGLCMAFTGIGGVIFNPLGTFLISGSPEGWRDAYLVFGIIILVGTLPFTALVIRNRPQDKGLLPCGADPSAGRLKTAAASPVHDAGVPAAEALRMPAFYALLAFSGLITLNQNIYQFFPSYVLSLSDRLPDAAMAAGLVASACMGGQALGKVLLGLINDRSVKAGIYLGCGSGLGGLALLLAPGGQASLLAGAFLFGIVYAMTTVQTPLLTRSVFGSLDYTAIYSKITTAGTLMGTVSAVVWSFVADSAGGYPLLFCLGAACVACCLALALFATRSAAGGRRS